MKLYIHIGARKTGTTSIQSAIKKNAQLITDNGIFVSARFGDGADNYLSNGFMGTENLLETCHEWLEDAKASGCKAAFLSSESLTDLRQDEIKQFKEFLGETFPDVTVIFYVRRQDIVATSHYSTGLRGGGTGNGLISTKLGKRGLRGFRYKRIADDWASVFGKKSICVRLFTDPRPKNWSALGDILSVLSLSEIEGKLKLGKDRNTRLDAVQAAYLQRFNIILGDEARAEAPMLQRKFIKHISDLASGQRVPKPSKAKVEEFYSQFQSENEALRETYRSDLSSPLFPEDFDEYPEMQLGLTEYLDEEDLQLRLKSFFDDGKPQKKA